MLDRRLVVRAVQAAVWQRFGSSEVILRSDRDGQFTSLKFTDVLKQHGIQVSMDGKGRWRDNVFVERLWRSVKYEEIYLHAYETVSSARAGLTRYFGF